MTESISKYIRLLLLLLSAGVAVWFTQAKAVNHISQTPIRPQDKHTPSADSTVKPSSEEIETNRFGLNQTTDRKILTNGSHTFQTFNNCGPASLSMALSYYNINVDQKILSWELRPHQNNNGNNDDKSVTLTELAYKAQEYDFITYHRPAGNIKILQSFINQDIPVITRTWLKKNEDIGHYRVVKGYDKNKKTIIQDDSLQGKDLIYNEDEFNQLWQAFNYEYLVLVPHSKQNIANQILGSSLDEKVAWQSALDLSKEQLDQNPDNIYTYFNQLTAHYYLGNYHEAAQIFEKIENRLPPRMLWYQIEPILTYYQLNNYDRVLNLSEEVFDSQNLAFSELHLLMGKVFEQQNRLSEAQTSFSHAQTYNSSTYWRYNLATIPDL